MSSGSGSDLTSGTSAEIIVSADEGSVRLRANDGLLVTLMSPKSSSSAASDLSFKDVKISSLTGAGTLLTMPNTFHVLYGEGVPASCVEIAMLSSTVSCVASSRVETVLSIV